MTPDWAKFVKEFAQPVSILMMFIICLLVVFVGYFTVKDLSEENTIYRKKLGKE